MIKRTLFFTNPAYLSTRNEQLVIKVGENPALNSVPIEDIGVILIDNPQITITQGLMVKLLENNVAFITCDEKHLPTGLMLNLDGHHLQSARFQAQLEATEPMRKQFWQQTVKAKIRNQARLLQIRGLDASKLFQFADNVRSGDPENTEARASFIYWKLLFRDNPVEDYRQRFEEFRRERYGVPPNNLLNYGYAILRAIVARSLVGTGLLPTFGIFHRNQYNAYCLADDIMEPYRPFVDKLVLEIIDSQSDISEITLEHKKKLLCIAVEDVLLHDEKSPLMIASQRTAYSLARCFLKEIKTISYPELSK